MTPSQNDTEQTRPVWEALDEHRIGGFVLRVGLYDNGRVALEAEGLEGPECTITVNLGHEPLNADEFHVRLKTRRLSAPVFHALMDGGIAHPTGRIVSAGYVEKYAEVWKFAVKWEPASE